MQRCGCVLQDHFYKWQYDLQRRKTRVIKLRHQQPTVWEGLFAEEVAELWEPWMRIVDELSEDEA